MTREKTHRLDGRRSAKRWRQKDKLMLTDPRSRTREKQVLSAPSFGKWLDLYVRVCG